MTIALTPQILAPAASNEFLRQLISYWTWHLSAFQDNNVDELRFPQERLTTGQRFFEWARARFRGAARRAGFVRTPPDSLPHDIDRLLAVIRHGQEFGHTYDMLGDTRSRDTMVAVLAHKLLGRKRVKLPRNTPRLWSSVKLLQTKLIRQHETRDPEFMGIKLDLVDLNPIGLPLCLHSHPMGILCTFLLEQYRYKHGDVTIEASPGDVVIEGGASWGDTTLYFADKVGAGGKVIAFEFAPVSVEILKENLSMNSRFAERVTILRQALWDESGQILCFNDNGPGTSASLDRETSLRVSTTTIDDMVEQQGLDRVDFIKMDIEGSELRALNGAERTLRKHAPKLAISVYHREDDLIAIPKYLEDLGVGYRFFIDHFTIHGEETVLFAAVQ